MFARYFVELPIPAEDVERALARDPRAWLPGLAERAHHRGDLLLAEVGFGEAVRIKRTVVVELGQPVRSGSKTVFPLGWAASVGVASSRRSMPTSRSLLFGPDAPSSR